MFFKRCHLTHAALYLSAGLVSSCAWLPNAPPAVAPSPAAEHPVPPAPVLSPDKSKPEPKETTWTFAVDSTRTKGKIDLSLDPKGSLLGAKPAQDTSPLAGKIHVLITAMPDGSRCISFQDLALTNTEKMHMPFSWSRLIGKITVNIPAKILKITKHTFAPRCAIEKDGTFRIPRNFFTVGGQAAVTGSGLVLKKAVGKRDVDLTIRKTEPVHLSGKLIVNNGTAILRIPSAVMHDLFDLEGTMLKLTFTGDITARAIIR